ncbi:MAG: GNAT family N-acetyltransferase [Solirubrobacteraceae bacterium]
MSGTTPMQPDAGPPPELATWTIREAALEDVAAVACAVADLLVELGAKPAPLPELEEAVRAVVEDPELGTVLVADADGELAGLLGVSWQHSIRIPGRYGTIQELWVHPAWRGRTVGGDLIVALFRRARDREVYRLEVGLPSENFPHLAATEAFYLNNGFTTIGLRMRRLL